MDGLTAVVTGAGRDVGGAVARRFAAAGARVVVSARDADEIDELVADVEAHGSDGGEERSVEGVRADVRDEYDVERLMALAARESDGGIDVVAACAEVFHGEQSDSGDSSDSDAPGGPVGTPLTEESYAAFDDTLRTNARGVFATVREAAPHLADDARVLVPAGSVSSESDSAASESDPGRGSRPERGSYAVSKTAAAAVARGFAAELDAAVGVVDPGATGPEAPNAPDPETLADLVAWAASEAAAEDVDGEVVGLAAYESATA